MKDIAGKDSICGTENRNGFEIKSNPGAVGELDLQALYENVLPKVIEGANDKGKKRKVVISKKKLLDNGNVYRLREELKKIHHTLAELPKTRNGLSTDNIRVRLETKKKEIETRLLNSKAWVSCKSESTGDFHLKKKLDALNKSIPIGADDKIVTQKMSEIIREKMQNIKLGHRLGKFDAIQERLEERQKKMEQVRAYQVESDNGREQVPDLKSKARRARVAWKNRKWLAAS